MNRGVSLASAPMRSEKARQDYYQDDYDYYAYYQAQLIAPHPFTYSSSLYGGDVLCLHALLAPGRLVGDLLAFFEGLEPAACYPAVVHEEVFASVVGLYEAVALLVVEPLNRSLG